MMDSAGRAESSWNGGKREGRLPKLGNPLPQCYRPSWQLFMELITILLWGLLLFRSYYQKHS